MPTVVQNKAEQKRVTITSKRQFTIPQKFYSALGFGREAICTMGDGMLIIQPTKYDSSDSEFADNILEELIKEGFSGQELLNEFRIRKSRIRPAVETLLEQAKAVSLGIGEYSTYSDIFKAEE